MAPVYSSKLYENASMSPLPPVLHNGYIALSFIGFLSFFTTSACLGFLTWRLIRWRKAAYNQFILLIYNLIFADMQQSIAFFINSRWAHKNALETESSACFAQGWFISIGQLGTGVWIFTIAVHTFASLILDYRLSRIRFAVSVAALWVFIYLCAIIGVAAHPNDIYMRAGAWCWINQKYAPLRLWLHYFWIFISMFGTTFIYAAIYIILRRRLKSNFFAASSQAAQQANLAAKYMVIYPLAYVICTMPMAAARMAAMSGRHISYSYYIFGGVMITSNGWLDVLLYTLTRSVIVFSDTPPVDDCGLDTFGRGVGKDGFGSTVVIEGGQPLDLDSRRKMPEAAATMKGLEAAKTNFKTTTVTVESHRRPIEDLEKLRLPTHISKEEDFGWDSSSSSSMGSK